MLQSVGLVRIILCRLGAMLHIVHLHSLLLLAKPVDHAVRGEPARRHILDWLLERQLTRLLDGGEVLDAGRRAVEVADDPLGTREGVLDPVRAREELDRELDGVVGAEAAVEACPALGHVRCVV